MSQNSRVTRSKVSCSQDVSESAVDIPSTQKPVEAETGGNGCPNIENLPPIDETSESRASSPNSLGEASVDSFLEEEEAIREHMEKTQKFLAELRADEMKDAKDWRRTNVTLCEAKDLVFSPPKILPEKGGINGDVIPESELKMLRKEPSQKRMIGSANLRHTLRTAINDGVYRRMRLARGIIRRINRRMRAECRLCRFRQDYECYVQVCDELEKKDDTMESIRLLPGHVRRMVEHLVEDAECMYCDLRLVIGELACVDSVTNEGFISIIDDVMDMKRFMTENMSYNPIIRD